MKTNVKETSIEAYDELKRNNRITPLQQKILDFMRVKNKYYTRKEIAKALDMETSTVSARVNELIFYQEIDVIGKKICPISKKLVEAIIRRGIND